jgi:RNA polymerase sigma-70 factor, ECF subfamily
MEFRLRPEKKEERELQERPTLLADVISDEDLWRAFQNGEDAAFNMLYGRYGDRVYSYLKILLVNSTQRLDDCFQEAWIHLFKGRETFTVAGKGSFAGWLFRLAHNMAISQLRKKKYSLSIEDLHIDTDLIEGFISPATQENFDRPTSSDIMSHVMKAVESLPLLLREVFVLSEFNGLSLEQIGATLGVTRQNARIRLFRARRVLREELAQVFDISGVGDAIQ